MIKAAIPSRPEAGGDQKYSHRKSKTGFVKMSGVNSICSNKIICNQAIDTKSCHSNH